MEDIEKVNKVLKSKAMSLGLCSQWTNEWNPDSSYDELIDKFKRGLDFCIKFNYPSNEVIKSLFDKETLRKNHVYVDELIDVKKCESDVYVIQGECDMSLTFDSYSVATIFVRHSSMVNIDCHGYSKVFVRVYDNSDVTVSQYSNSKVFVKNYSEFSNVKTIGDIALTERFSE